MKKLRTKDLLLCALFTALIIIGAFIRIPIPVIPITMQYMFTMLAGLLLGGKLGSISVLCYIVLGLAGVPVFTQGGGISYIFYPSFGYIIGFFFGTFCTGYISHHKKAPGYMRLLLSCFAGMMIVYAFGLLHYWLICTFYTGAGITLWKLLWIGLFSVIPGDIVCCFIAAALARRLLPIIEPQLYETATQEEAVQTA